MTLTAEDMLRAKKTLYAWHENNVEMVADIYDNHYTFHCMLCQRVIGHTLGYQSKKHRKVVCGICFNKFSDAVNGMYRYYDEDGKLHFGKVEET